MTRTTLPAEHDRRPVACSLTPDDYRARVADTGDLTRTALLRRLPLPGGARLVFTERPEIRERLEAFVAAESECCPFLTMDLRPEAGRLVLDVTGPAEAAPVIAELFAAAPRASELPGS